MTKWPVAVVLLSSIAGAQTPVANMRSPGLWSLVTVRNSPDVTLMVSATGAIEGSGSKRPILAIRCEAGSLAVYVGTAMPMQAAPGGARPVRLGLDDRPSYSEPWSQSGVANEGALFSPDPRLLIAYLMAARRLRFEFEVVGGRWASVDFPVAGLIAASPPLSAACPAAWRGVLTALDSLARPRGGNTDPASVYFEFQVEKHVWPVPGNPSPAYPPTLRSAKVQGEVLAQFVVDTLGQAEPQTFKVLKTTHELFTQAVRDVLPELRFTPAEVGGRKVRQLVQMPFQFNISR